MNATLSVQPVCLWQENPNRLVSLLELLVKYGHFFFIDGDMLRAAIDSLASIADRLEAGDRTDRLATYLEDRYKHAGGVVKCLETLCERLPLPVSKKAIQRAQELVARPLSPDPIVVGSLAQELDTLSRTISDELDCLEFMAVSPDRNNYLFADATLFGSEVAERFPASTVDIVEAGRCFALRRNTACVFHCMRVLEVGIQALGIAIAITELRPNWEPIIAKLEKLLRMNHDYLQKHPADLVPEVHDNREFYAGVSAYFNAVKIAWRNRVMHVGVEYSGEHALLILNATQGFMAHLSLKVKQIDTTA